MFLGGASEYQGGGIGGAKVKRNSEAKLGGEYDSPDEYKKLIAELGRARKDLDKFIAIAKAAASGRLLDAGYSVMREKDLSSKVIRSLTQAATVIEKAGLEARVVEESQTARLSYRHSLEELLGASCLNFKSEWPILIIGDLVRLEVDTDHGKAIVDGKPCTSMEPSHLVERVKLRISELLDRPFDAKQFAQALKEFYSELVSAQGLSFGEYVDIRQVFAKLRSSMKASGFDRRYSEHKFGADLFRLFADASPVTGEGMRIELSPAQSAMGGIYVPGQGGGNYIAAIRLTPVTHAS